MEIVLYPPDVLNRWDEHQFHHIYFCKTLRCYKHDGQTTSVYQVGALLFRQ